MYDETCVSMMLYMVNSLLAHKPDTEKDAGVILKHLNAKWHFFHGQSRVGIRPDLLIRPEDDPGTHCFLRKTLSCTNSR